MLTAITVSATPRRYSRTDAAEQTRLGNESEDLEVIFVPLCSVNPKKDYATAEIERCAQELGMQGLKLHFSNSQVDMRDAQTAQWVREVLVSANEQDLFVLLHFGDLEILCGECDDAQAPQDDAGMLEAMEAMLSVLEDESLDGLHLQFAHLTGVGNFPGWTQATFNALIEAYSTRPALDDLDIYVDVAAVFNDAAIVNGIIPGVTQQELEIMGAMLERWGFRRAVWGSDNNSDYVLPTQCLWPLSVERYNQLANTRGLGILLSPDQPSISRPGAF